MPCLKDFVQSAKTASRREEAARRGSPPHLSDPAAQQNVAGDLLLERVHRDDNVQRAKQGHQRLVAAVVTASVGDGLRPKR